MKLLVKTLAYGRCWMLRRQLSEVEKYMARLNTEQRRALLALTQREFAAAGQESQPHLYASEGHDRYSPWGRGTELALERMRSGNQTLGVRGVALWLAVAYHETKDVGYASIDEVHRRVLRSVRQLRESVEGRRNLDRSLELHGASAVG